MSEAGYSSEELARMGEEALTRNEIDRAKMLADLAEETRAREREVRAAKAMKELAGRIPAPPGHDGEAPETRAAWGTIAQAMRERRAISTNGTGINTLPGLLKALVDGNRLASSVKVYRAENSQSIVPIFNPHLALPAASAEGATGIAADSTAVLSGKTLTLKPWYSILQVSQGALLSSELEGELPGIFREAFAGAIDKAILVGTGGGNDALGVFVASAQGVPVASDVNCLAAGTPKWADMLNLAGQVIALGGDLSSARIVLHPDITGPLLSENTASAEGLKGELLNRGTIRGVKVIESSYAPKALVAGSYVAVGGYFNHYALAIAKDLTIDPIRTVGSDNVTFQAWMYMQGAPAIGGNFRRLKTV